MTRMIIGGPYASVWVCSRDACIQDAKEWAYATTHQEPKITHESKVL